MYKVSYWLQSAVIPVVKHPNEVESSMNSAMQHHRTHSVSYAGPSPAYLPLPAWPHSPQTGGCRPLRPLHGKLAPPWPSSVSGSESASLTTPSSSAADCSAAAPLEQHEPGREPQDHENIHKEIITPIIHSCAGAAHFLLWCIFRVMV